MIKEKKEENTDLNLYNRKIRNLSLVTIISYLTINTQNYLIKK